VHSAYSGRGLMAGSYEYKIKTQGYINMGNVLARFKFIKNNSGLSKLPQAVSF
jgi:hypothetical protein